MNEHRQTDRQIIKKKKYTYSIHHVAKKADREAMKGIELYMYIYIEVVL